MRGSILLGSAHIDAAPKKIRTGQCKRPKLISSLEGGICYVPCAKTLNSDPPIDIYDRISLLAVSSDDEG